MYNTRKFSVLVLILLLLATAVQAVQGQEEDPIKLAALVPITGPAANIGEEQLNWIELAVADFNEASELEIELLTLDTGLDPETGLLAAEAAIADEDVYGVVGPAGSQVVQATQASFTEANMGFVSSSATAPALTLEADEDSTFFRVVPHDDIQGPSDAAFLREYLGVSRLFVLDDQTSYAVNIVKQVEDTFTELGGEVVGRASISQDDQDFSSLVTRIGASGAEAIFFAGQVASQGALLANQLLEQGVDVTLLGSDGFFFPTEFIEDADGATEGAYVSVFAPDIRGLEVAEDVIARYEETYDDNYGSFGPPTYVAAMVVLEAIERAYEAGELSREAVVEEIAATDMETTILGTPLAFDENGDVLDASFYIFEVQDGQFVMVDTSEAEMAAEETAADSE